MPVRVLIFVLIAMLLVPGALAAPAALADTPAPAPEISLSPTAGPAGTRVEITMRHFRANEEVRAVMRVPGDPIVATGTTDVNGFGRIAFNIPSASEGTYWVIVTDVSGDCAASARFRIGQVPPTLTPSPTATVPPTQTPATTATPPTTIATSTPTATATPGQPRPPGAGSGTGTGMGGGFNAAVVLFAFGLFAAGFVAMRGPRQTIAHAMRFRSAGLSAQELRDRLRGQK